MPRKQSGFATAFVLWIATSVTASAEDVVVIPANGTELSGAMAKALEQLPRGGTIQLQAGTYTVTRQLDPVGIDNITVQGAGSRTVVQFGREYFGPKDRWIMNVDDKHDHWTFRDFTFDGNGRFSPEVCDRDKIIKLRGDHFTVHRVTVQNEAGRGFATILGDDQRWLNCNFNNIGTNATDSSVVHPGNREYHAKRVLVSGCMGDLGPHKVTFVDAVGSDLVITNNVIRNGKTGVILSWWKGKAENAVISNNILLSAGRACRVNKKKTGRVPVGRRDEQRADRPGGEPIWPWLRAIGKYPAVTDSPEVSHTARHQNRAIPSTA